AGGLDAFDQRVLGVGLEAGQRVAGGRGAGGEVGVDVGQRRMAVDFRLARAEQVEVGAVQDQQLCHRRDIRDRRAVWSKARMLSSSATFAEFKRLFELGL